MDSQQIQKFMELTGSDVATATRYVRECGGVEEACNTYFATEHDAPVESPVEPPVESPASAGAGAGAGSSSGNNSRFMSFADMVRSQGDKEDEEDPDRPRNTFAGGETSGLEVTDPNDANAVIKDLLEKARRNGEQLGESGSSPAPPMATSSSGHQQHEQGREHLFTGKGYRLGSGVDAASAIVEDSTEQQRKRPTKVTREITFWKEGFQVGEGPLFRYDDPANNFYLNELNQGRAPLKLLNVELGQEVEVNVFKKLDESYKPPKRKLGGFQGHGQRLGSPIPGESQSSAAPEVASPPSVKETTPSEPVKGDTSVQIRYASGTREVLRCFSLDTVQSLYDHVLEHTQDRSKQFTLNHAFPVKPITDMQLTLKDADLVNSVVVQRWA
ncbi:protein phosphatase regulator SHP1 KNAG_0B02430 [Huiozyma naganishii CBS 8797]|uniref:UBX domain-containing protein n=1 Tax=Huiozyma naganishii (strain ATCC MYA-139 / BCRC 22969 / CBS 8797 / KCTC 17520 / NBRC 10181 / NCYC 3082 / Yp74L-3) TaxID=1071383 RepID=J7R1J1_HUIN7|nr:hypothetical protein KNAG_0B02430 [Kazachstania naganishii CBS 8797]CCK68685.1 hypothetical protein KNAG_0B02430 [Kazachstania naganishii CBS 8797]